MYLDGVRVLDLSRLLPGPFCSMLLADMGADVIKVEDTRGGDYARYYPPTVEGGQGALYASLNRDKRGVALDLKSPEGPGVLEALVRDADVLIESFRPGVLERLGVGHDRLRELNPRLVVCAISGYGQDGPLAARAGHDLNYLALAGVLEQNGPAGGPPQVPGFQLADVAGGALYAALGVTAALFRRERTGEGGVVDVSMTEGAMSLHVPLQVEAQAGGAPARGEGMLTGGVPSYRVYATSDGRHLAVGALEPKFWLGFVQAIGAPELASEGLATGEAAAAAIARVSELIGARTLDEWVPVFEAADCCVEPVRTPLEVLHCELMRARRMFFELQGVRMARTPLGDPDATHTPAPDHGQHTDEVLAEAGVSAERIAELRAARVVI
jgi:crotonobetainyl-CoA:carnitine CoA-transferase CaiB-like acyl-CoA transferase